MIDRELTFIAANGCYSVEFPIFADWLNGALSIPQVEVSEYSHPGFGAIYEKELHLVIKNGRVIERTIIDNRSNF